MNRSLSMHSGPRRPARRVPAGTAIAVAIALLCPPLSSYAQSSCSGSTSGSSSGGTAGQVSSGQGAASNSSGAGGSGGSASGTIGDAARSAAGRAGAAISDATGTGSSGGTGASSGSQTASAATVSKADRRFAMRAAESDLFELRSSELATQKASSDAVRRFAQQMIDDHGKTSGMLKQLASARGLTPPTELDQAHAARLARLEKLSGAAFDREYMRMQRTAHRDAVALFERQARDGQDPDLKRFAAETLPALRGHVQLAGDVTNQVARGGSGMSDTTASASSTGSGSMASGSASSDRSSQVASSGSRMDSSSGTRSPGASTGTGGSTGGSTSGSTPGSMSGSMSGSGGGSTSSGGTGAASGASR